MTHRFDNNKIYRAALYCRLSKDDDDRTGDSSSIQTQKSLLEDYCRGHGFLIHGFYVDDGYSGLNYDRPDFQRMLTDIDNGIVNMVITKDLSRLGRDYIQTGYYTEIYFTRKRIRYIAVNDGYDSIREDNDIAPFRHILNDMYAKDLSRKVKSAKRQLALNGFFISSQAPYGYEPNTENRHQLVVDEEAAEVVKHIFSLSLSGLSAKEIAKTLTQENVLTPGAHKYRQGDTRFSRYVERSETKWCYETVQAILKDRVYAGDMENHKAEVANYKTKERIAVPKDEHIVVENTHEAIVSREDWEKVQQLVHARHRKPYHSFENIFRGILYCSDCGCKLTMGTKTKGGKHYHHYRCNNHYLNPDKCPRSHQISHSMLYDAVLERVRELADIVQDDVRFHELVRQRVREAAPLDRLDEEKQAAEKRLDELSAKVRKLFDSHTGGVIDDRNYEMLMTDIQSEQTALAARLAQIEASLAAKSDTAEQLDRLKEAILGCYTKALDIHELTPLILNKLIERIEVGSVNVVDRHKQQELTIVWRFAGVVK